MKVSPILWARRAQKFTELAKKDRSRTWARKTAEVIHICLRNQAPLSIEAIKKFSAIPPQSSDVHLLLPLLEKWSSKPSNISCKQQLVVGDLAWQTNCIEKLSPKFQLRYLDALENTNPFKAIEVLKKIDPNNTEHMASLYLAANQTAKASEIIKGLAIVSTPLMKRLISQLQSPEEIQFWINNKWQSMSPNDVNWLNHSLRLRQICGVNIPKNITGTVFPEVKPQITEKQAHLVSYINTIMGANSNLVEIAPISQAWRDAMSSPSANSLYALIQCIADNVPESSPVWENSIWIKILRIVDITTGILVLSKLKSDLPRAFATVISHAPTVECVERVLMLIDPDVLYTDECMGALANRSPQLFLGLAIPPELTGAALKPHHLVSLWRAQPPVEIIEWLLPLTMEQLDSAILLRAAVQHLRTIDDFSKIEQLLREYTINRKLYIPREALVHPHRKIPSLKGYEFDPSTHFQELMGAIQNK